MPFDIDPETPFGERAQRRLREERIAWLITTSEDGTPQPVPVWFLWDRPESFLLYSKPDTAKLRNIAERPRVSLHLDGDGQGCDIVVVLGSASVSEDPPAHQIPALRREVPRASSRATPGRPRASPPTTRCRCASRPRTAWLVMQPHPVVRPHW